MGKPGSVKLFRIKKTTGDKLFSWTLLLPAIIMTTVFILIPLVDSIFKSLLDFNIRNLISGEPGTWNNFNNYIRIINNVKFLDAILHTFTFLLLVVFPQFLFGMILALILNSSIKFSRFIRSLMMTPWVVPTVISALIWMWIYQPQYGLLKFIVSFVSGGNVSDFAVLNNPNTALLGIAVAALWKQIPLTALLILAGLQNVPDEMLEAATIDGASKTRSFFSIVLPYIKSVVRVTMAMAIIANFKQFPLLWTMTGGGPNNATTTLAILSYREAFVSNNLGTGAAVTTIWMLLMIVVLAIYNKLLGTSEIE